jgi:transcriptional regulator with XRE-family HTH domain
LAEAMTPGRQGAAPRQTQRPGSPVFRLAQDQEAIIRVGNYLQARKGFTSDSELAEVFPVNRSRISRWKRGEAPDPENARILRDLAIVVAQLTEYYEAEVIPSWLRGRNPDLGGRQPLDLIREGGHLPEILSTIEAQTSGAYL